MASVELAIRSLFTDDGIRDAETGLGKIISKLNTLDIEALESDEAMQNMLTRWAAIQKATETGFKTGHISNQIEQLTIQYNKLKQAALGASHTRPDKALEFDKEAQQVEQMIQKLRGLQTSFTNLGGVAQRVFTQLDFKAALRGAQNSKELVKGLKDIQSALIKTAATADETGDIVSLSNISKSTRNLSNFIGELQKTGGVSKATQASLGGMREELDKLASSHRSSTNSAGQFLQSLNRIGFSLFLVQSSIRTVTGVFQGFINVFKEGAEQASLFQAFDKAVVAAGGNLQLLKSTLASTSRGLLDQNKVLEATLRLMKAGVPDFERTAATMAGLAVNASKVSGELGNVDEIFEKLIKGIVRGSPRLIDDTDVVLKLGDAYERYAEKIGKASDELSEKEQQRAVVDALEEESLRMEELAEAVGTLPSEPFVILENSARSFTRTVAAGVGIVGSDFAGALVDALGLAQNTFETTEEAIKFAREEAVRMDTALERVGETIREINKENLTEKGFEEAGKNLQKFIDQLSIAERIQLNMVIEGAEIAAFWNSIVHMAAAVATLAEGFSATMFFLFDSFKNQVVALIGPVGEFASAVINKDFEGIKEAGQNVWDTWTDGQEEAARGFVDTLKPVISDTLDQIALSGETLHLWSTAAGRIELASNALEKTGLALESAGDGSEAFIADLSAVEQAIAQLNTILGEDAKLLRDSQKEWEKYGEKVLEINEDWLDKLDELHDEKLDRIKDNWEEFNDSILDINEELAEDLAELESDFADRREKEQKKHQKKKEKNEESHQDKIRAIMRRFELSRLRAIIDRDARALFEAEFRRDQDLLSAKEAAEKKKRDEDERHKEELEELEEQERKKREKLEREAAKARAKAEEDRQEEAAAIEEWHEEQKKKAAQAAIDAREQALEAAQDRIADMKTALEERRILEEGERILRMLEDAKEITEEEAFKNAMITIWNELGLFYQQNPLTPIINPPAFPIDFNPGDPGPAPPEPPPQPPGLPCTPSFQGYIQEGQQCEPGEGERVDLTCTRWRCVNGSWTRAHPGQDPGLTSLTSDNNNRVTTGGLPNNFTSANTGLNMITTPGQSGRMAVTIEAKGDTTLEAIFKSMAYEAYLEVTE